MKSNNHLFLVDGSGYIFRAYYALPPLYRKSDGLPTGAVNGFCNMLYKLIEDTNKSIGPTHLAVIFDSARKTFRNNIYKDYKANRGDPPEDLIPQFKIIKDAVTAFGIQSIEAKGFEADDIIATYADAAVKKNWQVSIVSSDKDLMQLVSEKISLVDTMKNKNIGTKEVEEKFGVGPDKVIDVQALAGDSSDNVPGAPGIGIKTAAQLINEFGNLEKLLEKCGDIKQEKRRDNIQNNKEQIIISKELVTLKKDVKDIPLLADLKNNNLAITKLVPFLEDLELKKLADRIRKKNPEVKFETKNIEESKAEKKEKGNVSSDKEITAKNVNTKYILINNTKNLEELKSNIYEIGHFVYDVETDSLNILEANLIGISICYNLETSYYIPFKHVDDLNQIIAKQIKIDEFIKIFKPIMEDSSIIKIGHNIKYDNAILKKYGISVIGCDDTMLMSYFFNMALSYFILCPILIIDESSIIGLNILKNSSILICFFII